MYLRPHLKFKISTSFFLFPEKNNNALNKKFIHSFIQLLSHKRSQYLIILSPIDSMPRVYHAPYQAWLNIEQEIKTENKPLNFTPLYLHHSQRPTHTIKKPSQTLN
jgi:hypothetical protein